MIKNKKSPPRVARIGFPFILVGTVCLGVAVLVPGIRQLHARQAEIDTAREQKAAAERCVLELRREIEESDTDEWIERVARDELHWAKPGETVFVFSEAPGEADRGQAGTPGERRP